MKILFDETHALSGMKSWISKLLLFVKGKIYFSPLPLEEARENLNSNSSRTNLLPSKKAFRVPVGRGRGGRQSRLVANAEVMEELRIL